MSWFWEISTHSEEVHTLLCACDAYTATDKAPAPVRNIETTWQRVHAGSVHVLRHDNESIAMFTLTWEPPFTGDLTIFPAALKPAYLGRLAVKPEWLINGSLVGVQCLRKAIELAKNERADAIRSEANPDLTRVRTLLHLFGFQEYGQNAEGGRRRVYLQKTVKLPV